MPDTRHAAEDRDRCRTQDDHRRDPADAQHDVVALYTGVAPSRADAATMEEAPHLLLQSARGLPSPRAARASFSETYTVIAGAKRSNPGTRTDKYWIASSASLLAMTRRQPSLTAAPSSSLILALIGLVLFGQGAYIHAKALLAQVLLERAFDQTIATGHIDKTMVMGRYLAGRAHRGETDRRQRHRAGGQQRTGAGVRPGPCRADARCRRARRRGLFRAPRYAFSLSARCRGSATRSMSPGTTARCFATAPTARRSCASMHPASIR